MNKIELQEHIMGYFEDLQYSIQPKENLIAEALNVAHEAIRNAHLEQINFMPSDEIMEFVSMPMQIITEGGIQFTILESSDMVYRVRISLSVQESQVGIAAFVLRSVDEYTYEVFADGKWINKFCIRLNELQIRQCETCPERESCEQYDQIMEAEWEGDMIESIPKEIRSILEEGSRRSELLETWLNVTDPEKIEIEDWKDLIKEYQPLIDLAEKYDDLEFEVQGDMVILAHAVTEGFAISCRNGKYVLYAYIDTGLRMETEIYTVIKKPLMLQVAESHDVNLIEDFLNKYSDRLEDDEDLQEYIIPLSDHAAFLYDEFIMQDKRGFLKKIKKYAARCGRKEKDAATAIERYLNLEDLR